MPEDIFWNPCVLAVHADWAPQSPAPGGSWTSLLFPAPILLSRSLCTSPLGRPQEPPVGLALPVWESVSTLQTPCPVSFLLSRADPVSSFASSHCSRDVVSSRVAGHFFTWGPRLKFPGHQGPVWLPTLLVTGLYSQLVTSPPREGCSDCHREPEIRAPSLASPEVYWSPGSFFLGGNRSTLIEGQGLQAPFLLLKT